MSEVFCSVVVEYMSSNEIKTVADFPLRIHNIGGVQTLAQALKSKDLETLVTRDGVNLPARLLILAIFNDGNINGRAVGPQVYNAVMRMRDFIAGNSGHNVRIYAHWISEADLYERTG